MAFATLTTSGAAFGGKTPSVDIPKPRNGMAVAGREGLPVDQERSLPTADHHPTHMLPTPPHSISPTLPPQAFRAHGLVTTGDHRPPTPHLQEDSDFDLRDPLTKADGDTAEAAAVALMPPVYAANGPLDARDDGATGAITPALLAKYHLPDILLAHGPLAIRHILSYLTISVPGFSRIPAARARRLVVSALEGRDSSAAGGGLNGDIAFEKVGWGRWQARPRSQLAQAGGLAISPAKHPAGSAAQASSLRPSAPRSNSLAIADDVRRLGPEPSEPTSWTEDSVTFSHEDDEMDYIHETMLEHEADLMSLDYEGAEHGASSVAASSGIAAEDGYMPDDGRGRGRGRADNSGRVGDAASGGGGYSNNADDDDDDVTDDEDWAGIGAAALRQASLLPRKGSAGGSSGYRPYPLAYRGGFRRSHADSHLTYALTSSTAKPSAPSAPSHLRRQSTSSSSPPPPAHPAKRPRDLHSPSLRPSAGTFNSNTRDLGPSAAPSRRLGPDNDHTPPPHSHHSHPSHPPQRQKHHHTNSHIHKTRPTANSSSRVHYTKKKGLSPAPATTTTFFPSSAGTDSTISTSTTLTTHNNATATTTTAGTTENDMSGLASSQERDAIEALVRLSNTA
jgi:hypothetical protein